MPHKEKLHRVGPTSNEAPARFGQQIGKCILKTRPRLMMPASIVYGRVGPTIHFETRHATTRAFY